MKKKEDPYCFETINDELNKLFNPGKYKLKEDQLNIAPILWINKVKQITGLGKQEIAAFFML